MVTYTGLWLAEATSPGADAFVEYNLKSRSRCDVSSPQLVSLCVTGTENMTIDGGPVHNNLSSLQTQHKWWSIHHKYISGEFPKKTQNFYHSQKKEIFNSQKEELDIDTKHALSIISLKVKIMDLCRLGLELDYFITRKKVWHRPWGCGLERAGPGSQGSRASLCDDKWCQPVIITVIITLIISPIHGISSQEKPIYYSTVLQASLGAQGMLIFVQF